MPLRLPVTPRPGPGLMRAHRAGPWRHVDPRSGFAADTEEQCLIRIIRWIRGTGHRAVFVKARRFATLLLLAHCSNSLSHASVATTGGCQRKLFVHTWPCANCARSMAQSMCAPTASNDVWLEEHCAQPAIHNKQSPPVNDATCLHGVRNLVLASI